MYQQINLYQPVLADTQQTLSATTVATVLGIVILALTGFTVHAQIRVRHLDDEVSQVRAQVEEQQAMLAQVSEFPGARKVSDPQQRAAQLAADLDARQRALELLKQGAAGQTTGFAQRMEALARQHVEGLWIDRMTLSGTNGSMTLNGVALDPAMVPAYLHNLAREQILSGTRFDEFTIERPHAGTDEADDQKQTIPLPNGAVRFRAGSRALAADAPENPS